MSSGKKPNILPDAKGKPGYRKRALLSLITQSEFPLYYKTELCEFGGCDGWFYVSS